jgi:hypothetical protein
MFHFEHYIYQQTVIGSGIFSVYYKIGAYGSIVVEALCCKPEGHRFKTH